MSTTTFRADPSDNLENVVEDTTPQLGGDLDVNTNSIVSTSNGDITLAPDGTGNVVLGVFTLDADQSVGAGQDNYVLTYDNGTGLISLEASSGGIADVVDDTTPQLGGDLDVNGNSIVSVTNGDINITPDGTGNVVLGSASGKTTLTPTGLQVTGAQIHRVSGTTSSTSIYGGTAGDGGTIVAYGSTHATQAGEVHVEAVQFLNGAVSEIVSATFANAGIGSDPVLSSNSAAQLLDLTGDLTISGDLTVSGTTVTVNTATYDVEDPLINLGHNNTSSHAVDLGFYGTYDPAGTDLYCGLFFDATDDKWKLYKDSQTEPTTTVNTGATGHATATLVADIEGNITSSGASNLSAGTLTVGVLAGTIDAGGATSLEIPNGAAPTVNAAGEIAVDTTITDYTGLVKYHDGTEELTVVAMPTANLSTTDGDVVSYDAANNEFTMSAAADGDELTTTGSEAGNTFSAGDAVYYSGSAWTKSDAAAASTAERVGIVTTTGDPSFTYSISGKITLSGLTAGTVYFLQDGGGYGTSEGTISVPLFFAISTTEAIILPYRGLSNTSTLDEILLTPGSVKFPSSNPGALDQSATHDLIAYDDTTEESNYWSNLRATNYGSGTLKADICYSMAGANTTDDAKVGVSIYAISDGDSADLDTASYDTENTATVTVPDTAGYPDVVTVTLTNKDSIAAGDLFAAKFAVKAADAAHTVAGDFELRWIRIYEE